jgi:hypothetical protein
VQILWERRLVVVQPGSHCRDHLWERRLEVRHHVECVVAYCLRCGRMELCWSRRPVLFEEVEDEIATSSRGGFPDKE